MITLNIDRKDLLELHKYYKEATQVCDPVCFQNRQKNLLWKLCEIILKDMEIS